MFWVSSFFDRARYLAVMTLFLLPAANGALAQDRTAIGQADPREQAGFRPYAQIEGNGAILFLRRPGDTPRTRVTIERLKPTATPELSGEPGQPLTPLKGLAGGAERFQAGTAFRPGEFVALRVVEESVAAGAKAAVATEEPRTRLVFLEVDENGVAREIDWERYVCDGGLLVCEVNDEGDREIDIPLDREK